MSLLVGLSLCAQPEPPPVDDLPALVRRVEPAIVHIDVKRADGEGNGSGFLVSENGWLVTNHHVIDLATEVRIKTATGRTLEVEGLLITDPKVDLAIIKVSGHGNPFLELGTSDVPLGTPVVNLSSPMGLERTLSEGIVSGFRTGVEDYEGRLVQTNASISPGSSGSPLIGRNGQVIGVVTMQFAIGQNLNFAVPVEKVRTLIDSVAADAQPRPFDGTAYGRTGSRWTNLIISLCVFAAIAFGFFLASRSRSRKA